MEALTTCNSSMPYAQRHLVLSEVLDKKVEGHLNMTSLNTWLLEELACLLCYSMVHSWQRCANNYSRDDIISLLQGPALNVRTVADVRTALANSFITDLDPVPTGSHSIGDQLKLYISPIILFFGILGNTLSFAVLTSRALRRVSTYNYLAGLSVADSLVLLTGLLPRWLAMATGGDDIRDYSLAVCRVSYALSMTVSDFAVWLLVAVTVDRYVAVVHSLSAPTYCTRGRSLKVVAGLFYLMAAINAHFLFTEMQMEQRPHSDGRKCSIRRDTLTARVWPWADAAIYSFLPFITISALNLLIICHLSAAKRRRLLISATVRIAHHVTLTSSSQQTRRPSPSSAAAASDQHHQMKVTPSKSSNSVNGVPASGMGGGGGGGGGGQETGTRLTAMLLTVTFAFLVTTLPMNFTSIASAFVYSAGASRTAYTLLYDIAELLMFSNHAMNFYLYCATGRRFRHQLCQLACRHGNRKGVSTRHPSDLSMYSVACGGQSGLLLRHPWTSSQTSVNKHKLDVPSALLSHRRASDINL